MCVCVRVWVHVHAPSLVLVGGLGNVISCAGRRVGRGVLFRLTLSKSHFQLWRTVATDLNQGFYFRTHTHTHTCADTEEGGGGLAADSVCGNLCINSIFPKALHWGSSSSCFHKDPQTLVFNIVSLQVCVCSYLEIL